MFMEILKMLLPFISGLIGGGAVGALINEWFHRRRARMQPIPLIERVNRLVRSELKGFILARTVGDGKDRRLEEIQRVREYQFTLRNSSYIHLHNAEIQFEFPSADVEAWAERPARSKTAPVLVESVISKPWKMGYRWRIPEFPPGDSIEFTFRAIDALSDEYEVALYGGGQVVIEKSKGEPIVNESTISRRRSIALIFWMIVAVVWAGFYGLRIMSDPTGSKETYIEWAGCSLNVTSSSRQVNFSFISQAGPWSLNADILNTGSRKCFVKWESDPGNPVTIEPSRTLFLETEYTSMKPRLVSQGLLFGPDGPMNKATVKLYVPGAR